MLPARYDDDDDEAYTLTTLITLCFRKQKRENKGVHTFPKGICPKVNVIARLEYELAYYDSAVHRFKHYTTRTPTVKVLSLNSLLYLYLRFMSTIKHTVRHL